MRTAICRVCGNQFTFNTRGSPRATCSDDCRRIHERQAVKARQERWAARIVAHKLLREAGDERP